jgi:MYXO-CTERM domain-containing protein
MRRTLAAVTTTAALTLGGVVAAPAVFADTTVAQESSDQGASNPDGSDKTGLWGLLGLLGLAGLAKKKETAGTSHR